MTRRDRSELAAMLGGAAASSAATKGGTTTASGDALTTKRGLVAVGPGPSPDGDEDTIDLDVAEPRDLVADPPGGQLGASALATGHYVASHFWSPTEFGFGVL